MVQNERCRKCGVNCAKSGFYPNGKQRYRCKGCGRNQVLEYSYTAYRPDTNSRIVAYLKEGVGIRGTARLLKTPKTTVLRRKLAIAVKVRRPELDESGQLYEMDELRTYIKNKQNEVWICYAINRKTRQVVDFVVGRRTKGNLSQVTESLISLNPERIFTDGLSSYRSLIPGGIHRVGKWGTIRIERMNLTLRTHLRRLGHRTIGFTCSLALLASCLRLYFWA